MNHPSTNKTTFSGSQSLSSEALATLHDSAKQRAQALRREAVSGLIEDMVAWLFRRSVATPCATTQRSCATTAV